MKVPYNGKMVDAKIIDFITRKEDFNEYQLCDGTVLKMKSVVVQVSEIIGEKMPNGGPVYHVQVQTVFAPMGKDQCR